MNYLLFGKWNPISVYYLFLLGEMEYVLRLAVAIFTLNMFNIELNFFLCFFIVL